jgi:hypothetical protein
MFKFYCVWDIIPCCVILNHFDDLRFQDIVFFYFVVFFNVFVIFHLDILCGFMFFVFQTSNLTLYCLQVSYFDLGWCIILAIVLLFDLHVCW